MPWLYKPKHSRFWRIADYIPVGGPVRSWSTKCEDEEGAKKKLALYESMKSLQEADRLNDQMYQAITGKRLPVVSLKTASDQWLAECKVSTAKATHTAYERTMRYLCEHLKATESHPLLKDVSTSQLFGYLAERRKEASAATANLERTIFSIFFLRCIRQQLLTSNPMEGVKAFKAKDGETAERRVYTLDELKAIYQAAPDDFWRYMILGGFYTALRMGDLITLQAGSVKIEADVIIRKNIKTGKVVHIPIAVPLRDAISPLLPGKKPKDYLWPEQAAVYIAKGASDFSKDFRNRILKPCGLIQEKTGARHNFNEVVFHCLRHSMNSEIIKRGAHKSVAQALLGHKSERTNDGYTHADEPAMRKAIDGLPRIIPRIR